MAFFYAIYPQMSFLITFDSSQPKNKLKNEKKNAINGIDDSIIPVTYQLQQ